MRIAHLAVYVRDLEQARDFFTDYFGGKANDGYHNPKTGFCSYFIRFDDGRYRTLHECAVEKAKE